MSHMICLDVHKIESRMCLRVARYSSVCAIKPQRDAQILSVSELTPFTYLADIVQCFRRFLASVHTTFHQYLQKYRFLSTDFQWFIRYRILFRLLHCVCKQS